MSIVYDFNYELKVRGHVAAEVECRVEIDIMDANDEIDIADIEMRDRDIRLGQRGDYFTLLGTELHAEIRSELFVDPKHRDNIERLAREEAPMAWLPGARYARIEPDEDRVPRRLVLN